MNFLLTAFTFLFQESCVWCLPWPVTVLIIGGVVFGFYMAYREGMLSWLPGFKTSTKHVQTKPPPPPSDEPPAGPINV